MGVNNLYAGAYAQKFPRVLILGFVIMINYVPLQSKNKILDTQK